MSSRIAIFHAEFSNYFSFCAQANSNLQAVSYGQFLEGKFHAIDFVNLNNRRRGICNQYYKALTHWLEYLLIQTLILQFSVLLFVSQIFCLFSWKGSVQVLKLVLSKDSKCVTFLLEDMLLPSKRKCHLCPCNVNEIGIFLIIHLHNICFIQKKCIKVSFRRPSVFILFYKYH